MLCIASLLKLPPLSFLLWTHLSLRLDFHRTLLPGTILALERKQTPAPAPAYVHSLLIFLVSFLASATPRISFIACCHMEE